MILPHITACPNCSAPRTKPLKCHQCGWLFKVKPLPAWVASAKGWRPPRPKHPEQIYKMPKPLAPSAANYLFIRGFRVPAADIENRLVEHPAIRKACAVLRLAGKSKQPAIVAFVELREGAVNWQTMTKDLREWCRGGMSAWKMPDRVVPVAHIGDREMMAKERQHRLRQRPAVPVIRHALNEFHFEGIVYDLRVNRQFVQLVLTHREEDRQRGISVAVNVPRSVAGKVRQGALVAVSGRFGFKTSLHANHLEVRERKTLIRLSNTQAVLEAL